jgi:hypothetical protein
MTVQVSHSAFEPAEGEWLPAVIVERPSRSGGAAHQVTLNPVTLRPERCTCPAGRAGVVCHAALAVASEEAYWSAWDAMLAAGDRNGYSSDEYHAASKRFQTVNLRRYVAEAEIERRDRRARRRAA